MSSNPDEATPQEGEIRIDASQLRPGVHVRLPVSWVKHQFMFSSFVIENEEQVRLIAAMKLPQLFCDPARCKVPPRPLQEVAAVDHDAELAAQAERESLAALEAARMDASRERERMMEGLRQRLVKAGQLHHKAAATVSSAIRNFGTSPRQSVKDLTRICEESTTALFSDPDSAFVLVVDKARNDRQAVHALSVMTLSLLLGKQAGLSEQALRVLGTGALLHDIGARLITPSILRNPARNRHEEKFFRAHCRNGYDEALQAGALSPPILEAILSHHERCDGSGFPDRLMGNAIPLTARMVGIADRFDTLVNPGEPRLAIGPAEALATMWSRDQKGFDSGLLQLFVRAMGVYPPGSIVQLSDGQIGTVVGSAPVSKPLAPKVMIYAPEVPRHQAIIADLATQEVVTIERPLRLQDRSVEELN
ncbi:HD-GYP domain-containing protein, partial [Accumulibacter sp.]